MKKVKSTTKKSGTSSKLTKEQLEEWKVVFRKGSTFGDSLIIALSMIAKSTYGFYAATIGLAQAYAALKSVAAKADVKIDYLFEKELQRSKKEFNNILDKDDED